MLAAVSVITPNPDLMRLVATPLMRPTVPELLGVKVTELVASTLVNVMFCEAKLTSVRPVPPPTDAKAMLPVPAVTVRPCAPPIEVVVPTTVMLAPPDNAELISKVPEPFNNTLLL